MLKFVLIVVLIFFVFPKLLKWALRGFVVSQINKAQQQQYQQQQYNPNPGSSRPKKRDGQVDVDFVQPKSGKNSDDFNGGEYIDYEEVKD